MSLSPPPGVIQILDWPLDNPLTILQAEAQHANISAGQYRRLAPAGFWIGKVSGISRLSPVLKMALQTSVT
jgi:hypothetical protein